MISLRELSPGDAIQVLGPGGTWIDAALLERGRAPLWEIVLERSRAKHVVFASAGQRWPVNSAARRFHSRPPLSFRTDALRDIAGSPRWKLVTVNPLVRVALDPIAVLRGIVFGDGTYHRQAAGSGRAPFCQLYLCNDPSGSDSRRLAPLFERAGYRPVVRDDCQQVRFYGLPPEWKALPAPDRSPQYLRGFVAGWFAADGHMDPRAPVALLASARRDNLEWLQRIAPGAGLAVSTSIGLRRSQSTFGPSIWHSLGISASTLDADFLLLPEKRARYRPAQFMKQWKIVSARPAGLIEQAYAIGADGGQCVVEGNVLIDCEPLSPDRECRVHAAASAVQ